MLMICDIRITFKILLYIGGIINIIMKITSIKCTLYAPGYNNKLSGYAGYNCNL